MRPSISASRGVSRAARSGAEPRAAAAMRPQIVGRALNKISEDPEIEGALFEVLETQKLIDGEARLTLMPRGNELLAQLLASTTSRRKDTPPATP